MRRVTKGFFVSSCSDPDVPERDISENVKVKIGRGRGRIVYIGHVPHAYAYGYHKLDVCT